jgi:hypothetical protein
VAQPNQWFFLPWLDCPGRENRFVFKHERAILKASKMDYVAMAARSFLKN